MPVLSMKKVNVDMIGDALGVAALIITFVVVIWIAYGIGLPTGGDELIRVMK